MYFLLGGVVLSLAFVIAGGIIVARALPGLRRPMARLKVTLDYIPIAKAIQDIERLQRTVDGLEALVTRARRIGRATP